MPACILAPRFRRFCVIVTLNIHQTRLGNYRPSIEPAATNRRRQRADRSAGDVGFSILRSSRVDTAVNGSAGNGHITIAAGAVGAGSARIAWAEESPYVSDNLTVINVIEINRVQVARVDRLRGGPRPIRLGPGNPHSAVPVPTRRRGSRND